MPRSFMPIGVVFEATHLVSNF